MKEDLSLENTGFFEGEKYHQGFLQLIADGMEAPNPKEYIKAM